ncbi:MAG: hypothetical protein AB1429_13395 [Pseudomonadota bacterium]
MSNDAPLDADGFLRLAERKRAAALALVDNSLAAGEAWMAAGYAVEFALKACVMRREGLGAWPAKKTRPELYTHNLRELFRLAGIELGSAPEEVRAPLRTVLDWDRALEYNLTVISPAQARTMVAAAFGESGVVAWLIGL